MAGGFDGVPDLSADSDSDSDKERASPDMAARLKTHAENKKNRRRRATTSGGCSSREPEEPSTMQYMPRKVEQLLKMPAAELLNVR